jgi:hypothetical protein
VISGELFVEVVWQSDASCLEDVAHLARGVSSGCDDTTILFDGGLSCAAQKGGNTCMLTQVAQITPDRSFRTLVTRAYDPACLK